MMILELSHLVLLCDSPCNTRAISECFTDKELIYKALYKFNCLPQEVTSVLDFI